MEDRARWSTESHIMVFRKQSKTRVVLLQRHTLTLNNSLPSTTPHFSSPSPLKTSPPSGDKASPMMHPQILTQKCSGTDLPGSWHTYQWRQRNIVMGCLQAKEPGSMARLSSKLWGPGMLLVIFLWVLRAWPYLGTWLFVWLPQMPYSCTRKLSWHPWLFQKLQSWFWSPKDFKNLRHLQLGTRGMPLSPRDTAHA